MHILFFKCVRDLISVLNTSNSLFVLAVSETLRLKLTRGRERLSHLLVKAGETDLVVRKIFSLNIQGYETTYQYPVQEEGFPGDTLSTQCKSVSLRRSLQYTGQKRRACATHSQRLMLIRARETMYMCVCLMLPRATERLTRGIQSKRDKRQCLRVPEAREAPLQETGGK